MGVKALQEFGYCIPFIRTCIQEGERLIAPSLGEDKGRYCVLPRSSWAAAGSGKVKCDRAACCHGGWLLARDGVFLFIQYVVRGMSNRYFIHVVPQGDFEL